jgi:LysR family transcriptional regulator, nod-box dependent transcriptional activator
MRFRGLDLNLLVAFEALLVERSVSRAAQRMNLSQPAMSAALSRLRDYFGDDILVSHGKRMHPTAYAEGLLPRVHECLAGLESLVLISPTFSAIQSQRTFHLAATDYITAVVIVPLVARLAKIAPHIRLDIMAITDQAAQQLDDGKIDLLITPDLYISSDHPAELLFEEQHVIVGWRENPVFRGEMTETVFFAAGHIAVRMGNTRTPAFADRQLELMGRKRRIEITAGSFSIIPQLLRGTTRLALMHERLARVMSRDCPIASAPLPFQIPPMREMVQHHRARSPDEGLTWLRSQLAIVAAEPVI